MQEIISEYALLMNYLCFFGGVWTWKITFFFYNGFEKGAFKKLLLKGSIRRGNTIYRSNWSTLGEEGDINNYAKKRARDWDYSG